MIIDNCYVITPETAKEVELANEAILKFRQEEERKKVIRECKMAISFKIADSIDKIGLTGTKRVVKELLGELKELEKVNDQLAFCGRPHS